MVKAKTEAKLPSIQILRGFAALLIVVWHSDLALESFRGDYWRDVNEMLRSVRYPFWANHLCMGVDLFFCISGFIMTMLAAKATQQCDSWRFLRDRATRILPPYWFFTLFLVLLYVLGTPFHIWRLNGQWGHDFADTALSLVLWPQKNGPILGVGWTLVHEYLFYLFVSAALFFGQGKRLTILLGLTAFIGTALYIAGLNLAFPSLYYVEFFMGSATYLVFKRTSRFFPFLQILSALPLYLFVSYMLDATLGRVTFHLINVFGSGLIGLLLISGLHGVHTRYDLTRFSLGRFAIRLGDASYSLYLSHWFTLSALGLLARPLTAAPTFFIIGWHIMAVCVAVCVALVFAFVVELPLHRRISALVRKI